MFTNPKRDHSARRFEGKVAALTGSARGIGKNIATAFAREGALVIVCDVNDENGKATVSGLCSQNLSAEFLHVDLANRGAPQEMIRQIIKNHERLDILVNNARASRSPSGALEDEDWDLEIAVSLKAVFFACQEAIRAMAKYRGGSIVNISSTTALLAAREVSPVYQIAKVGLTQLTRYFAVQAGADGVRVNALLPGFILQDEHLDRYQRDDNQRYRELVESCVPIRQPGRSDNVADAVLFLCSPEASFISGQCLVIDGGMSVQEQFSLGLHLAGQVT